MLERLKKILKKKRYLEVALNDIDFARRETSVSFTVNPQALTSSIKRLGLLHPVYLAGGETNGPFATICGHRRINSCLDLGLDRLPAFILCPGPERPADALLINILENLCFREFNEIERSNILHRFKTLETPEEEVIEQVMPVLGMERSKKIYEESLKLQDLIEEFKIYCVEIGAPLRLAVRLALWNRSGQKALFSVISGFRPGKNKLLELVELIEEISIRDGALIGTILNETEVVSVSSDPELSPSDKAGRIRDILWSRRFPLWSGKKRSVEGKIRGLRPPKGARLRYPENFEGDELTLTLSFSDSTDLAFKLEAIRSQWKKKEVEDIFRLLRE